MLHFISLFFYFLSLDPSSQTSSETTEEPYHGTHVHSSPMLTPQDTAISQHPPWLSLQGLPEEAVPPLSISQSNSCGSSASICFTDHRFSLTVGNGVSVCFHETFTSSPAAGSSCQQFKPLFGTLFLHCALNLSSFLKFRMQLRR